MIVAVIGNLVAASFVVFPLFFLSGKSVRLLWECFESGIASLMTLVVVLGLSIVAWRMERHRITLIPILFLAFTPFFFSSLAMHIVAHILGVIFEE